MRNKKALRVLFSTVIDAKYGVVIDSILGKYNSNEREFLKQHIKNIEKFVNLDKVILIMDAGHYSLELKIFLEKSWNKIHISARIRHIQKRNFTNDKNRRKLKNQQHNF